MIEAVEHLDRLGIQIEDSETKEQIRLNNQISNDRIGLRLLSLTHQGQDGWLLDHTPEFLPLAYWDHSGLEELSGWLEEIIRSAVSEGVVIFVPIQNVQFADEIGDGDEAVDFSTKIVKKARPKPVETFRQWLLQEWGFSECGKSPNGLADMLVYDPKEAPDVYAGIPRGGELLREFIESTEAILENFVRQQDSWRLKQEALDEFREWQRMKRDLLKELREHSGKKC